MKSSINTTIEYMNGLSLDVDGKGFTLRDNEGRVLLDASMIASGVPATTNGGEDVLNLRAPIA